MATRSVFRARWKPASSIAYTPSSFARLRTSNTPWRMQQRTYAMYRQPFNYQRFQQSRHLLYRWSQSRYFYHQVAGIGGAAGGFYIYNLEEVPVSHRRRFNIISPEYEAQTGQELYTQVMQEYGNRILPESHPQHRMAQRVLERLLPHSGLPYKDHEWELHVIQDPQKNAFVIPGGKVFVFSGILDVCQGEQGLAAVLGHEIAHNVAHHAAERMSGAYVLMPVALLVSGLLGVGDFGITQMAVEFGFLRPGGRKQESEADYIGLMMMTEACYDPHEALELWKRMEKSEKGGPAPPQFLSTHPSTHNRVGQFEAWLPQAERKQAESDCGAVSGFADSFRSTFNGFKSER